MLLEPRLLPVTAASRRDKKTFKLTDGLETSEKTFELTAGLETRSCHQCKA